MRINHNLITRMFYRLVGRDPWRNITNGSSNSAVSQMDIFWTFNRMNPA